jgi:hypothetical protein
MVEAATAWTAVRSRPVPSHPRPGYLQQEGQRLLENRPLSCRVAFTDASSPQLYAPAGILRIRKQSTKSCRGPIRRSGSCEALTIVVVKWASRPLGCSARRPRYRARSGLLRRCTPVPVPVAQLQSRSGLLNRFAKFFTRFEEGDSLRWHLDPSAGLWIASRGPPRCRVLKVPNPRISTLLPPRKARTMLSKIVQTTISDSFKGSPMTW